MKLMMLILLPLMIIGCANNPPSIQEYRQHHRHFDPHCQRGTPPIPHTPQGFVDLNSPQYQEQLFKKRYCY